MKLTVQQDKFQEDFHSFLIDCDILDNEKD